MSRAVMTECKPCYMCGSPTCRESMPHGNHTDWLAFVAIAADPNDPWGRKTQQSPEHD